MAQNVRSGNALGTASLVLGIIACLGCWIPFLCVLSLPVAGIGLLLAGIGFLMAIFSKASFSSPIGGGIVCIVALVIASSMTKVSDDALKAITSPESIEESTSEEGSEEVGDSDEASDSEAETDTSEKPQKKSSPKKEEPKGPKFTSISLGEKVSLENAEFQLDSVEWSDEVRPSNVSGTYSYMEDTADEKYIIIRGTFKNKASEAKNLPDNIKVQFIFNGKYKYWGHLNTEEENGTGLNSLYSTKPLKKETIVIYASVPDEIAEDWEEGVLQFGFRDNLSSSFFGDDLEKMENRYELKLSKP
ncbi:MAG: hypothetical protein Q4A17_02420 [Thermoguttaceae bacterium]|nr:hypothetical protein [Thermoguttaceae bacterium]